MDRREFFFSCLMSVVSCILELGVLGEGKGLVVLMANSLVEFSLFHCSSCANG